MSFRIIYSHRDGTINGKMTQNFARRLCLFRARWGRSWLKCSPRMLTVRCWKHNSHIERIKSFLNVVGSSSDKCLASGQTSPATAAVAYWKKSWKEEKTTKKQRNNQTKYPLNKVKYDVILTLTIWTRDLKRHLRKNHN